MRLHALPFLVGLFQFSKTVESIDSVTLGLQFPVFKVDTSYDGGGHDRFASALIAIDEINDKTDGNWDNLLPGIEIKYVLKDSKRDSSTALQNSLHLSELKVDAVIGPASSGPSTSSTSLLSLFDIPTIGYSATSPSLSDNTKFPYFSRTCVSDSIQAVVAAQLVKYELRWDSIYVIGEIGSYSEFGVAEFVQAATDVNLRIVGKSTIQSQTTEGHRAVVQELASSGAQIVFLFVQAGTGGIFLREAAAQGLFGGESGFVYIVGDSMAGNANSLIESLTTSSTECSGFGASGNLLCTPGLPNEEVGAAVKGMLGVAPLVENDRLDSFMTRYSALTPTTASCGTNPVTVGIDCSCADGEDSVGTKLWRFDHDVDPITTDKCAGRPYNADELNTYAPFSYDAVVAFAHAAHNLLVIEERDTIDGNLLMARIKAVAFEGLTGSVKFTESGDRDLEGVKFKVVNFKGGETSWTTVAKYQLGEPYEPVASYDFPTQDNAKPSGVLIIVNDGVEESALGAMPTWVVPAIVAVLAIGGAITTSVYRKVRDVANLINNLQVDEGEELILDPNQSLKARCKFDRNEQYAWGTTELVDVFFDLLSLSYLFLEDFDDAEESVVLGTKLFYAVVLLLSFGLVLDGWAARLKKIKLLHKLEEGKVGDVLDHLHSSDIEASAEGTQRKRRAIAETNHRSGRERKSPKSPEGSPKGSNRSISEKPGQEAITLRGKGNINTALKEVTKRRTKDVKYNRLIGNSDPLIQYAVASMGEVLLIRQTRHLIVNDLFGLIAAVLVVVLQGGIDQSEVGDASLLAFFPVISIAFKIFVIGWKLNLFRRRFELRQEIEETAYYLLKNDNPENFEDKLIDVMADAKNAEAKEAYKRKLSAVGLGSQKRIEPFSGSGSGKKTMAEKIKEFEAQDDGGKLF